ncbi:hypothetical protein FRC11_006527 [Ceratobasidium sp. 423]|nr:hypothetical protein FRC11_006527 [Ceratobasidium sp. 423]
MEGDRLVVNPAGEAQVCSEWFCHILKARAIAGATYTTSNLLNIPQAHPCELPDKVFMKVDDPVDEDVPSDSSSSDSDNQNCKKKKKKRSKTAKKATDTIGDQPTAGSPTHAAVVPNDGLWDSTSPSSSFGTEKHQHKKNKQKSKCTNKAPEMIGQPTTQENQTTSLAGSSKGDTYQLLVSMLACPPCPKGMCANIYQAVMKGMAFTEESWKQWIYVCNKVLNQAIDPTNTRTQK